MNVHFHSYYFEILHKWSHTCQLFSFVRRLTLPVLPGEGFLVLGVSVFVYLHQQAFDGAERQR